ncbi:hypothetical protein Agabi119p4_7167 [Agaricus bisporus var. burnettii]|uniref:RlpA-like protein double-psi beta-barrel domain-containing protein n=1 Tax=Agaricus bisporus var. burnettii TaxID=192524 RepID=A0A8H7C8G9_AGABI|nr:hypothetical protein Agabi119p4_7167 [Agaricus bisporus var. burnettii]
MMFFRAACTVLATLGLILSALGAPAPTVDTIDAVHLEKRITHTGRGTWFHVGLGNCGKWNKDSDYIVAISKDLYDNNKASNCDQYVEITNTDNGRTIHALTRDSCPSCGYYDLDLSPDAFKALAPLDQGVMKKMKWHFMNRNWHP